MMLTEEKYLLIALLSHRTIDLYDFYARSNFSTGQIARAVLKFQSLGYLIFWRKKIARTPLGMWKLKKLQKKELANNNRYWAQVPEECLKDKITINEPIDIDRIRIPKSEKRRMVSKSEM